MGLRIPPLLHPLLTSSTPSPQNLLILSGALGNLGESFKPLEWWNHYLYEYVCLREVGRRDGGREGWGGKKKKKKPRQKRGKDCEVMKG